MNITKKNRKRMKWFFLMLFLIVFGFIALILNETKDEVNANFSNVKKLNRFYNQKKLAGFAVSVFSADVFIGNTGSSKQSESYLNLQNIG